MTITIARRQVETYGDYAGWKTEQGTVVAMCQRCAETKPLRALYSVPVPAAQVLADGPTICVCARCRRQLLGA